MFEHEHPQEPAASHRIYSDYRFPFCIRWLAISVAEFLYELSAYREAAEL